MNIIFYGMIMNYMVAFWQVYGIIFEAFQSYHQKSF